MGFAQSTNFHSVSARASCSEIKAVPYFFLSSMPYVRNELQSISKCKPVESGRWRAKEKTLCKYWIHIKIALRGEFIYLYGFCHTFSKAQCCDQMLTRETARLAHTSRFYIHRLFIAFNIGIYRYVYSMLKWKVQIGNEGKSKEWNDPIRSVLLTKLSRCANIFGWNSRTPSIGHWIHWSTSRRIAHFIMCIRIIYVIQFKLLILLTHSDFLIQFRVRKAFSCKWQLFIRLFICFFRITAMAIVVGLRLKFRK